MGKKWRRKNYFIKRDLQGRYIFTFFLFVVIGSILFTVIFSLLSSNTLTVVYDNYNLRIGKTPLILLKDILSAQWIFIVISGLLVIVLSMFLTHRFAGPLYRFERTLESLIEGNLKCRIHLRKKDEAKEMADLFNVLIERLTINLKEIRRMSEDIQRTISEPGVDRDALLSSLGKIEEDNKRIRDILKDYTLEND